MAAILAGFSPRQVWSIVRATARANVWVGAIRSGKTIASFLAWPLFVHSAPTTGALVVVGRTRESVARNVFVPLQDRAIFGRFAMLVSYTAGAPTGTILGRTVHVLGASDARAEIVLRGLTVAGAYVDESTLVAEAFWTQLLGRMSVPGAQLFATTNPRRPRALVQEAGCGPCRRAWLQGLPLHARPAEVDRPHRSRSMTPVSCEFTNSDGSSGGNSRA